LSITISNLPPRVAKPVMGTVGYHLRLPTDTRIKRFGINSEQISVERGREILNEAVPVGKYMGQFFDHLGFSILDEWYVLSEFHGSEEMSTKGRMLDIRGLPGEAELGKIRDNIRNLYQKIICSQSGLFSPFAKS
jgi:hypothetical protein